MIYRFGQYELDEEAGELRRCGEPVAVQPKPFELLRVLLRGRDRVVPSEELFEALWPGVAVTPGSLSRAVSVARRAIGDGHRGELLRSVARRGYRFAGAVAVVGAAPRRDEASAPARPAAAARPAQPSLVGREAERALLGAAFEEAVAGQGSLVLVTGPPGIGKTRLVEDAAGALAAGRARVLVGRSRDGEGVPTFWLFAQVLRQLLAEEADGALLSELAAGPPELADLVPDLAQAAPPRAEPAAHSPEQGRFLLFDAVTRALARASRRRPLLLLLEDVQCAGPGSLRLLEHLSFEVAALPMLVVATVRDDPTLRSDVLERTLAVLRQQPRCRELPLGGLSRRDVAALLEAEIGRPPPADLSSELFARTEGVPLFLREAIRLLAERGDLRQPERVRRWAVALPAHVLDLVRRPLERVSPECADLLAAGSVLGREFAVGLAVRVAGVERGRALDLLDEAEAAGVVEASPDAAASWRFSHAMFHEAVYARLPAGRRTRLHARAAEAIEERAGADLDAVIAELAHHHHQALAVGDAERAFATAVRAAERARRLHAYDESAMHWTQAHAALEHRANVEPALRFETLLALGEAYRLAGDRARREETFASALEAARALGRPEQVARAAIGLCDLSEWSAPDEDDREAIALAIELLGERGDVQHARLLARSAYLDAIDAPERAVSDARRALELARASGDAEAVDETLYVLHVALWGPDHGAERVRLMREVAERAEATTRRDPTILLLLDAAADRLAAGDPEGARRLRERAAAVAGPHPHPGPLWNLRTFDAGLALLEGRFDDAEGLVAEAAALGRRIAHPYARAVERGHRALLARERDDAEEMLRLFDPGRTYRIGAVEWTQAFIGRSLAAAGRGAEAQERLVRLAAAGFEDVPRNLRWTGTMVEIANLCADLGDETTAPRLRELLEPVAGRHAVLALSILYGGPVSRALARLLALEGRLAEASDRFEEAEAACEANGARPMAARIRVEHGALLLRRGSHRAGRERLAGAASLAEELGLAALAACARSAVQRATL